MSASTTPTTTPEEEEDPLEFEDWDGASPFWVHCAAGSMAGVAEHVVVYPLDTVKTHIQCATCPANNPTSSISSAARSSLGGSSSSLKMKQQAAPNNGGLWTTMRHIVSQPALTTTTTTASAEESAMGVSRLWRGVQTVMIGCIPAHALYFSSYEAVKMSTTRPDGSLPYWAGLLAGAAAVIGHDCIMTPLDTIKQRLQLGHYTGMRQATLEMMKHEGTFSLFRSLPVTLLTNIPYGSIMVSTNEVCKVALSPHHEQPSLAVYLVSSAMGGMVASFCTTPLDRIKTVLQIQQLQPAYCERYGSCPKVSVAERMEVGQAISRIWKQEGVRGLFKGSLPRMLSHTPAVAISWTTYETAKQWLTHL